MDPHLVFLLGAVGSKPDMPDLFAGEPCQGKDVTQQWHESMTLGVLMGKMPLMGS